MLPKGLLEDWLFPFLRRDARLMPATGLHRLAEHPSSGPTNCHRTLRLDPPSALYSLTGTQIRHSDTIMTRLTSLATAAVACLAASTFTGTVSAQSSTSGASASSTVAGGGSSTGGTVTMTSGAVSSAATAASAANGTRGAEPLVTVEGTVPAYANGTQASLTATIEAVWSTHFARGALTCVPNSFALLVTGRPRGPEHALTPDFGRC